MGRMLNLVTLGLIGVGFEAGKKQPLSGIDGGRGSQENRFVDFNREPLMPNMVYMPAVQDQTLAFRVIRLSLPFCSIHTKRQSRIARIPYAGDMEMLKYRLTRRRR